MFEGTDGSLGILRSERDESTRVHPRALEEPGGSAGMGEARTSLPWAITRPGTEPIPVVVVNAAGGVGSLRPRTATSVAAR